VAPHRARPHQPGLRLPRRVRPGRHARPELVRSLTPPHVRTRCAAGAASHTSSLLVVPTVVAGVNPALRPGWPRLLLGIFAVHGLAEEIVWRSYAYRRLREGRSFGRAVARRCRWSPSHTCHHGELLPYGRRRRSGRGRRDRGPLAHLWEMSRQRSGPRPCAHRDRQTSCSSWREGWRRNGSPCCSLRVTTRLPCSRRPACRNCGWRAWTSTRRSRCLATTGGAGSTARSRSGWSRGPGGTRSRSSGARR
jgi:hypothetical protein